MPQINAGEKATLRINGIGFDLPFTVINHDGEAAHISFTLDSTQHSQLSAWISANFERAAA